MKQILKSTIFFLFLFGCKTQKELTPIPKPIADFTFSESTNGEVKFTNTSKNATSYQWDFGDNTKATNENPSHTYIYKGDYSVKLTAKGEGGDAIAENTVQIKTGKDAPPIADFSFIENKGEIQFTNSSKFADSYQWDFGDGTSKSTEKEPKHKYTSNQNYDVILSTKGKGGETTITKKVVVKAAPEPTKIYITKITVVKFPPNKPDGTPWDGCCTAVDARPDVYPTFQYGKSELWSGEALYVKDANPNLVYSFIVSPAVEIRFPIEKYGIYLYDRYGIFDGGYPMGGLTFIPKEDLLKGYPSKAKISCTDCTMEFEVELKYEY